MRNRFLFNILFLSFTLVVIPTRPMSAQEFVPEQVVFPITDFGPDVSRLMPFSIKFGTGFCLDPKCLFVGTNYHVAKLMGKHVRIKGVPSAHLFLDSGPDETSAQEIAIAGVGYLKYDPAHDLAVYQMRQPLRHFHGISFDTAEDLASAFSVEIYAYPLDLNPKRKLTHWHGKFTGQTLQGLLSFSYEDGRIHEGASGGIVVDSKTNKIVAVICGLTGSKERVVLAVPVRELSAFMKKADPYLETILFPNSVSVSSDFVSPIAADVYEPYSWPRGDLIAESFEVKNLRLTARELAHSMRNFVATETFAWGHDDREPEVSDSYEVFVTEGEQRWRHSDSKKIYRIVPSPPVTPFVSPGGEWLFLPEMLGSEFNVRIHEAPDAMVGGQPVHVFQYAANASDKVCNIRSVGLLKSTEKFYDCHGEVWMDKSGNILRISQAMEQTDPWQHFRVEMTYGWVEKDGTRHLVPVTLSLQSEYKRTYWCWGVFTDYQMFGAKSRVLPALVDGALRAEGAIP